MIIIVIVIVIVLITLVVRASALRRTTHAGRNGRLPHWIPGATVQRG